ncbi:hypothetical protein HaLaN_12161 [Haematococcus lacustris]|uniref:Uncharacterized protein n=1 Tax=Haematococcus lacustris TaxID=44745 RepID=A0A699YZY0_HAELA|nr:hypothetical protein HaLaN_12161 [Haematococcus lacustris]
MKGSRSKPGGLSLDCTSGSIAGAAPSLMPLHTTRTIDSEQLRRSKNYLALSGAQCLPKDRHLNSCGFAPFEARRTSTLRHTVVSAAAEGAQLRQSSHGCGCTRGSVAWGHQLQQSWQLHVPATTMLQQLQQGLHWGIGDGAGKAVILAGPHELGHQEALPNHCHHAEPEQQAEVLEQLDKGDSPWWRPTLLPLKQL